MAVKPISEHCPAFSVCQAWDLTHSGPAALLPGGCRVVWGSHSSLTPGCVCSTWVLVTSTETLSYKEERLCE